MEHLKGYMIYLKWDWMEKRWIKWRPTSTRDWPLYIGWVRGQEWWDGLNYLWINRGLTIVPKVNMLRNMVAPSVLYDSESWASGLQSSKTSELEEIFGVRDPKGAILHSKYQSVSQWPTDAFDISGVYLILHFKRRSEVVGWWVRGREREVILIWSAFFGVIKQSESY